MGRIGCLLVILLLFLVGYNQWHIEKMRREVSAISQRFHVEKKDKVTTGGGSDLVTALAQTERYTVRAKDLIRKNRPTEAQAELDKALKSLRSANKVSRDIVGDAAQFLGKARENAVRMFQKAWNEVLQDANRKK